MRYCGRTWQSENAVFAADGDQLREVEDRQMIVTAADWQS